MDRKTTDQFWIDVCGVVGMIGLFVVASAALSIVAETLIVSSAVGLFLGALSTVAIGAFAYGANLKTRIAEGEIRSTLGDSVQKTHEIQLAAPSISTPTPTLSASLKETEPTASEAELTSMGKTEHTDRINAARRAARGTGAEITL